MSEESQPTRNALTPEVYGLFAGGIDQSAVQRFHNALTIAANSGVKKMHLLFQSTGGYVSDGISLYNLFRASPVDLTLYNVGGVQSVAAIAYLGAKEKVTSAYGAFMIHRAYLSPTGVNSDRMLAGAGQLSIEDERIEAIIRAHTHIPDSLWDQHKYADVWFSAADAVKFGIADRVGEFSPPPGARIFNVWPPQN